SGFEARNSTLGRDHMWVTRAEVQALLRASGKRGLAMPATLVARLVRFHLVDSVRGIPGFWEREEVRRAAFTAQATGGTAARRAFVFHGGFAMRTSSGGRGYEGTIVGDFDLVVPGARVARFRAVASGQAW